jgi:TRAP-type uncharacterized transport system substrate-binding protein
MADAGATHGRAKCVLRTLVCAGRRRRIRPQRPRRGSAILAEEVASGGIEAAFVNPSALLTQAYRGVGLFRTALPVRILAMYPSWDRFVFMVHPKTGIRSLADIKAKKYPLRVSVREDPTHSTLVLIDQALSLHGFALNDIESWGGRLVVCGSPFDARRMEPLRRGEIDAVFDEGIKTWLDAALSCGLMPLELDTAEFEHLQGLGWRRVALPKSRFSGLTHNMDALDFSGWPIFVHADLADGRVEQICAALEERAAMIGWQGAGPLPVPVLRQLWKIRAARGPTPGRCQSVSCTDCAAATLAANWRHRLLVRSER